MPSAPTTAVSRGWSSAPEVEGSKGSGESVEREFMPNLCMYASRRAYASVLCSLLAALLTARQHARRTRCAKDSTHPNDVHTALAACVRRPWMSRDLPFFRPAFTSHIHPEARYTRTAARLRNACQQTACCASSVARSAHVTLRGPSAAARKSGSLPWRLCRICVHLPFLNALQTCHRLLPTHSPSVPLAGGARRGGVSRPMTSG